MRNIKSRIIRRIPDSFWAWLVGLTQTHPIIAKGLLASLQSTWGLPGKSTLSVPTRMPSELHLELNHIGYADIVFEESFSRLESGLSEMYYAIGQRNLFSNDPEKIGQWFDKVRNGSMHIATQRVGGFDLTRLNGRHGASSFSWMEVSLTYFAPSIITLSITAITSDDFKSRLEQIMTTDADSKIDIMDFSFKSGITKFAFSMPTKVKAEQYRALFRSANSEICSVVKKYLATELAVRSRLPEIQIFETLNELEAVDQVSSERVSNAFAESIGFDSLRGSSFVSGDSRLFVVNDPQRLPSYKLVLHRTTDTMYAANLMMIMYDFGSFLAAESLVANIRSDAYETRSKVVPAIRLQRIRRLTFLRGPSSHAMLTSIVSTRFQLERLSDPEIIRGMRRLASHSSFSTIILPDSENEGSQEAARFIDRIAEYIAARSKTTLSLIDSINSSYKELLNWQITKRNYFIQVWMIVVTFLILALTVAVFLPQDWRESWVKGFFETDRIPPTTSGPQSPHP